MAIPNYSNDAHLDITYLLVFNRISLQERLRLRIICQRWKAIIEADTVQMTTLRVFADKDMLRPYMERIGPCKSTPPTGDTPRYDVNRYNTIILSRPRSRENDLSFLSRLFPAVQNLALDLKFEEEWEEMEEEEAAKEPDVKKIKLDNPNPNPDVFGLLRLLAPNLHSLYLNTGSYAISELDQPGTTFVGPEETAQFWACLTLMQSTLTTLTFIGINIQSVPESLVLHHLVDLGYFHMEGLMWNSESLTKLNSPNLLHRLAPALKTLRLPDRSDFWTWQLPPTVSTLGIAIGALPKFYRRKDGKVIAYTVQKNPYSLPNGCKPSPGITNLEIEPVIAHGSPDELKASFRNCLPFLPVKFPSLKSLKIVEVPYFINCMIDIGMEVESGSFRSSLLWPSPLNAIVELELPNFLYPEYAKQMTKYDAFFRGLAVTFKHLEKLIWSVEPEKEADHQFCLEKCTAYQLRYLPKVKLTFVLDIAVRLKIDAFKDGPEIANGCHLSSGCVLSLDQ